MTLHCPHLNIIITNSFSQ
ncbi:unnamed protein product [Nezara viridula]|uniref:Uncharacterized protein n=1 Tax=Nezara viridula TaxID=85310 RepID=A0A9P0DWB0_NEZVI|nr:unnamed protein product [Nezara viridula]